MSVKLLTEQHLEFLSLTAATQAGLSLHLSKCHTVGSHMSRLIYMMLNLETNNVLKYDTILHFPGITSDC